MKKILFSLIFVITAVIIVLALQSCQANSQALFVPDLDPITIIREFMRDSNLEVLETDSSASPPGAVQRTFVTPDRKASFVVDMQAGQLVKASLPHAWEITSNPISKGEALSSAREFLSQRLKDFDKMVLVGEKFLDHHAGGMEYRFDWAEQLGTQHAAGIHSVSVSVGAASGEVFNFSMIPAATISVDVEPTISQEKALSIAEQHFGSHVVESNINLGVWWKDNDRRQPQVLRWTVELICDESTSPSLELPKRAVYIIDAHTGEILEELR